MSSFRLLLRADVFCDDLGEALLLSPLDGDESLSDERLADVLFRVFVEERDGLDAAGAVLDIELQLLVERVLVELLLRITARLLLVTRRQVKRCAKRARNSFGIYQSLQLILAMVAPITLPDDRTCCVITPSTHRSEANAWQVLFPQNPSGFTVTR